MLVKRSVDLKYSDVTPREIYLNRRKLLYGMGLAGGLALAGESLANLVSPSVRAYASTKLSGLASSPFSTTEKITPEQVVTTYNNYYEFGTDKGDPAKNAQKFVTSPWTVSVEGEVRQAAQVLDGRNHEARAARGAHLPASLRGGLVDRGAVDRFFAQHDREARGAEFQRAISWRSKAISIKKQMPLWGRAGIELPYVEGLRMDEAMHPLALLAVGMYGETLPEPGWRARPHGDSVEIRIQEHQVDRENQIREESAADHLEHHQRARIRFLLQRESEGGSSALEPGQGSSAAGILQEHAHADVQRLRRPGREPLQRHGPEEKLLSGRKL